MHSPPPILFPRPSTTALFPLPRSSSTLSATPSGMPRFWRSSWSKKSWMQRRSGWIRWWRWSGRNPFRGRRSCTERGGKRASGKEMALAPSPLSHFHVSLGPYSLAKGEDMRNGHYPPLLLAQNLYGVIQRTTEFLKTYFQDHNRCFIIWPQFSLILHYFLPSILWGFSFVSPNMPGLDKSSWLLLFPLLWIPFSFLSPRKTHSLLLVCSFAVSSPEKPPSLHLAGFRAPFSGSRHTLFILWRTPLCTVAPWPSPGCMLTEDRVPVLFISVASGPTRVLGL